jgi:hypothetical protein
MERVLPGVEKTNRIALPGGESTTSFDASSRSFLFSFESRPWKDRSTLATLPLAHSAFRLELERSIAATWTVLRVIAALSLGSSVEDEVVLELVVEVGIELKWWSRSPASEAHCLAEDETDKGLVSDSTMSLLGGRLLARDVTAASFLSLSRALASSSPDRGSSNK